MSTSQPQSNDSPESLTLRDFLYVNEELVTSLYSQLFEGVAESIVDTYVHGKSHENETSGAPFSGEAINKTVSEATRTTQSRVLYDHMYSQLEEELEPRIKDPGGLTIGSYANALEDISLVRVTGDAMVADFSFLRTILKNWERIADAIVTARTMDDEDEREAKRERLKEELETTDNRDESARLKKLLEAIPSEEEVYDRIKHSLGLHETVEWNEEHLSLILDLWYGDSFEAIIERETDQNIAFRGALREEGLRQKRSIRRLSNAGRTLRGKWTMVGLVQSVPENTPDPNQTGQPSSIQESEEALLRDNFRDLLQSLDEMNALMYRSGMRKEILLRPLALYQNLSI
jgi:hypothetical protein